MLRTVPCLLSKHFPLRENHSASEAALHGTRRRTKGLGTGCKVCERLCQAGCATKSGPGMISCIHLDEKGVEWPIEYAWTSY